MTVFTQLDNPGVFMCIKEQWKPLIYIVTGLASLGLCWHYASIRLPAMHRALCHRALLPDSAVEEFDRPAALFEQTDASSETRQGHLHWMIFDGSIKKACCTMKGPLPKHFLQKRGASNGGSLQSTIELIIRRVAEICI